MNPRSLIVLVLAFSSQNTWAASAIEFESAPGEAAGHMAMYDRDVAPDARCNLLVQPYGGRTTYYFRIVQKDEKGRDTQYSLAGDTFETQLSFPASPALQDGQVLREARKEKDGGSPFCYLGVCGPGSTFEYAKAVYRETAPGFGSVEVENKTKTKYFGLWGVAVGETIETTQFQLPADFSSIESFSYDRAEKENSKPWVKSSILCKNLKLR